MHVSVLLLLCVCRLVASFVVCAVCSVARVPVCLVAVPLCCVVCVPLLLRVPCSRCVCVCSSCEVSRRRQDHHHAGRSRLQSASQRAGSHCQRARTADHCGCVGERAKRREASAMRDARCSIRVSHASMRDMLILALPSPVVAPCHCSHHDGSPRLLSVGDALRVCMHQHTTTRRQRRALSSRLTPSVRGADGRVDLSHCSPLCCSGASREQTQAHRLGTHREGRTAAVTRHARCCS